VTVLKSVLLRRKMAVTVADPAPSERVEVSRRAGA
jgi:hypothetical protein